jgi:alkylation response protein AidB-like acyl-CoA dehydrogenase
MSTKSIISPDDPLFDELCASLAETADEVDARGQWPAEQVRRCADYGVYRWFVEPEDGGLGWSELDLMRGYLRFSAACLTTTFILTQATGAVRRIAAAAGADVKQEWLPKLLAGEAFTTLGISHLTTSRRHLAEPVLRAEETRDGFLLDGFSPWVTGGAHADCVVLGAQMQDRRQLLAALPMDLKGVTSDEPAKLVGLTASCTGAVRLNGVRLERRWLLDGPKRHVMAGATGAKTGGLQTSALAIGLAGRAIEFLEAESQRRDDLIRAASNLRNEHSELEANLLDVASGNSVRSGEQLRSGANSLALRATQATLAAAKGTGYVQSHPVGRWCREALFFLVWSCPQPVMAANLCELAGITD